MPGRLQRILYTAEAVAGGGTAMADPRADRTGRDGPRLLPHQGRCTSRQRHPIPREPPCQIIARRQRPAGRSRRSGEPDAFDARPAHHPVTTAWT
jgi:hypothetical protein